MTTWRVQFETDPDWARGRPVSCVARWRALRWFSDAGVGSCEMGPGRVRFVLEIVLDVEGADLDGGSSWRLGLNESITEARCNRVDADKSPTAEYLTMGVCGAVDVWARPLWTRTQRAWHTI